MVAKKAEAPLQKHTMSFFEGDYQKVQDLFPDIGAGPIIRQIVRDFIERTSTVAEAPQINEHISL